MEGAQAAEKEREREREERRLMRQRGAGARELKDAKFAFGFKFPSISSFFGFGRAASSSAVSSTEAAQEASEESNPGNREEAKPEEYGEEGISRKETAAVEVQEVECQPDDKKRRKRSATGTASKDKTMEVKKRAKIVEAVDGEQAAAAPSPNAKTLETKETEKPKPRKRGRPAANTTSKPIESRKRTNMGTVESRTEDVEDQEAIVPSIHTPVPPKRRGRSRRVAASAHEESKSVEFRKQVETSNVESEIEDVQDHKMIALPKTTRNKRVTSSAHVESKPVKFKKQTKASIVELEADNVKEQEAIASPIHSPVPAKRITRRKRDATSAHVGSQPVEFRKRAEARSVELEIEDIKDHETIAPPIHSPAPPKTVRSKRVVVSANIDKDKIRGSDMEAVVQYNEPPPRITKRKAKNNRAAAIDNEADVQLEKSPSEILNPQVELDPPTADKDGHEAKGEPVVSTSDDKQEDKDEDAVSVQSPRPKRRGKRSKRVVQPVDEESVKTETANLESQPNPVKKQSVLKHPDSSVQKQAPSAEDAPMKKRRGRPTKRLKSDEQPLATSSVGEAAVNDANASIQSAELASSAAKEDQITLPTVQSNTHSLEATTILQTTPREKLVRKRGRKPTKKAILSDPPPQSLASAIVPPRLSPKKDIPCLASLPDEEPTPLIEQPLSSPSPTQQIPDGSSSQVLNVKDEPIPVKGQSTVIPSSQASLPSLSSSSTTLDTRGALPASSLLLNIAPRPINLKLRKGKALFYPSRNTQPLLSSRDHYSLERGKKNDAEEEEREDVDWLPRPSVPKSLLLPSALSSSSLVNTTATATATTASDTVQEDKVERA